MTEEQRLKKRAYDRVYYLRNRERLIACANRYGLLWRKQNPERAKAINKRHRWKVRHEAIQAYGGRCVCCGESQEAFLSIDHVFNNGAKHRREHHLSTAGYAVYRWLKSQGYPKKGFRVLCYNCNFARHYHGGTCPHQMSPSSDKRRKT